MELSELQPELQSSALMGSVDMESNKRAPIGFQGVRGKKWTGKFLFHVTQTVCFLCTVPQPILCS